VTGTVVSLPALYREAATWDAQSDALAAVATNAEALRMSRLQCGIFTLLHGAYDAVVDHVSGRCREGAVAMTEIATTLRANADDYARRDAAVAAALAPGHVTAV